MLVVCHRMANVHDVITTLPSGYDTIVGERGLKISGAKCACLYCAGRVVLGRACVLSLSGFTGYRLPSFRKIARSSHVCARLCSRLNHPCQSAEVVNLLSNVGLKFQAAKNSAWQSRGPC